MSAPGIYWVASDMAAISAMVNTIAMSPSRAAYYATAECKVSDHLVTVTKRNCRDGSISHGKRTAWKPALCNNWQHISMTVYLAICQVFLNTAAGLLQLQAQ